MFVVPKDEDAAQGAVAGRRDVAPTAASCNNCRSYTHYAAQLQGAVLQGPLDEDETEDHQERPKTLLSKMDAQHRDCK